MLTSTLRDLENLGLVSRVQFNGIPPNVEYLATESAAALRSVFAMEKWGDQYLP